MKKLFSSIIMLLLFSGIFYAQDDFEGVVKFKVDSEGNSQTINYMVKDGSFKMEVPGEASGSVIMKDGKMLILMPEQKMYMETPINLSDRFEKDMDEKEINPDNIEDFKTGKTKEILGHEAEQYIYSDDDNEVEVWVAKDLGTLSFFSNPMQKKSEWQNKLDALNYFPLLMIAKNKKGKEVTRFEVVELEEKSLPADMFEVPADYNKMNMMGMPERD